MKKNISINIGGIIFHIEEDGYDILKNYLETINRYFSNYDDSQDIVSDIENRIAELFLSKLKDDKQIISKDDVESLMATLGSIDDFKTTEQDYFEEEKEDKSETNSFTTEEKRLFRDTNHKVIGGVASGIANYFKIDALWIRLLFLLPLLDIFFFQVASSVVIITYIVLWVVIPSNPFLKEDKSVKKFYRSVDNKVLGGVARGLALYFGVDVSLIRVLFILLLIPGGAGFFIYLVLWIITPAARTVTQKMQMEGTPITLSNIERNVKSSFNVEEGEENTLVKVLLFPFRLIAMVLDGLAKLLGPLLNFLLEAIRVVVGVLLILGGLSTAISFVVILFTINGWFVPAEYLSVMDIPWTLIENSISPIHWVTASILFIIPPIFFMVAGISLIAKRWVLNKKVGLTLLFIYLISIIVSLFLVPKTVLEFHEDGEVVTTDTIFPAGTTVFKVNEDDESKDYGKAEITFYGYEGEEIKIEKEFSAKGLTEEEAANNAKMVSHNTTVSSDSIVTFDRNLTFSDTAVFRAQQLEIDVMVPFGKEFVITESLKDNLRGTLYRNGYTIRDIYNYTWKFEADSGLICINCPNKADQQPADFNDAKEDKARYDIGEEYFYEAPFSTSTLAFRRFYPYYDFNKIEAATGVFVVVKPSNQYAVYVYAEEEEDLEDFMIEQSNSSLRMQFEDTNFSIWDLGERTLPKVYVEISVPEIRYMKATSAATIHLKEFKADKMKVDVNSAGKVFMGGVFESIEADISSAAKLIARGKSDRLNLDVTSAAKVNASQLDVERVYVDLSSAGSAYLNVSELISGDVSSGGKVTYKGRPRLEVDVNSGGRIRQK